MGGDRTRLSALTVSGIALVLLGTLVMAGWLGTVPQLVRIAPGLVPTTFNAGLCIFLFGFALLAAWHPKRFVGYFAGAVLFAVGVLTLAEYMFHTRLGIDELVVRDWLDPGGQAPGRMSANAAALWILVGTVFLLGAWRDSRAAAAVVAWASGFVLLVAAAWVILRLPGLEWTGWVGFKEMSLLEAVGCAAGGVGLLALSARWSQRGDDTRSNRLAALTFLLLATVGVNFWQALASVELVRANAATQLAARSIEAQLLKDRHDRYAAFERLIARFQHGQGRFTIDDWAADAERYLDGIRNIRSLLLVDAEGRILRLVTRRPELAIPDDRLYAFDDARRELLARALSTMRLVISPPMEMRLGGVGFQLLMPFDTVDGPLVMVVGMAYAEVFDAMLRDVAPGYAIEVSIAGEPVFNRTGGTVPPEGMPPVRASLAAPGAPWELRVWPMQSDMFAPHGILPVVVLLLALVGSLLVAVSFRYAMLARARLKAALDATTRLRTEQAVSAAIWESSRDVICTTDREGRFVRVSDSSLQLWGYAPGELEGTSALDLVVPEDLARSQRVRDEVPLGRPVHSFVNRMRHRDGSVVFVSWSAQWSDALGLNVALARNVTTLMEHEQELVESEERLRVAVEQTGRLVYDRPRGAQRSEWVGDPVALLGMSRETLLAISDGQYWQRAHPDDRDAAEREFTRVLREGGSFRVQYRWQRPDGRWIWLEDAGGVIDGRLVAVKSDITEQREVEASLEARVAQRTRDLVHANTELESFSYSVSHDLRTPLRAIAGFAELLREQYGSKLDETANHYLARIENGATRMAMLIDDLLTLGQVARRELVRRPVNLSEIVTAVISRLQESEPERSVVVRVAPEMVAECDPRLAEVVLENLLANAWKFARDARPAVIEVDMVDGAYCVRDNGVGFDMQHAGQLFGVFQRLHALHEFPGTGIGLATVKRVVERHGGSVWAQGEVGKGASFYFTFAG